MSGVLWPAIEIVVGAVLVGALIVYFQATRRKEGTRYAIGVVLVGAALYYLPLDKLSFQWTGATFFPDLAANGAVWLAISTAMFAAGVLFIRAAKGGKGRRRR